MPITAQQIKDILDNQPTVVELFIIRALEELLGDTAFDALIDEMIPATVNGQTVLFGHKLGDYSGLDRTEIKAKFTKPNGTALDDNDVDEIFLALGVVE